MNEMQEAELERRYKLVRVDPQHLFILFNQIPTEFVQVPRVDLAP